MKKIFLFLSFLVILLSSCSDPKPASELEAKCEALMEKYPNYESNEIAYKAVNDSIAAYCESFIGKDATILKGLEFEFVEIYENKDTGAHPALLEVEHFAKLMQKEAKINI